jgi:hypothetical protein
VQGYVIGFDAGDPIQPFTFQLRNPIQAKRHRYTEVGRKANLARSAARRKVVRRAKAAGKSPNAPEVETAARDAAKSAYTEAVSAYPGEQVATMTGSGRRMPPRVFKRKERSYGHRLLRINQEKGTV